MENVIVYSPLQKRSRNMGTKAIEVFLQKCELERVEVSKDSCYMNSSNINIILSLFKQSNIVMILTRLPFITIMYKNVSFIS